MTKVLVAYYSTYGHVESLAKAIAAGARSVAGVDVVIKRVPEIVTEDTAGKTGAEPEQRPPVATPEELADYDAIIFGTPTRYGRMAAPMANFLDQTGALWLHGKLIGKIGSVFTSTASQHGGQETTLTSFHVNLLHLGMIIAGVPYSEKRLLTMTELSGGTPYGATTITAGDGSRQPSENELAIADSQGRHVAELTAALMRGKSMQA